MKYQQIPMTDATGQTGRAISDQRFATATAKTHEIASAEAWFAGGERVGYDPETRAMVGAQGAPLNVFVRKEGDLTHAVSFLPGFPDGSFGWASVLQHLPNAAEMPKLFVEYVGMGDSDKPKDYAYSTANVPISSKRSGASSVSSRRRWSHSTFPRLSFWSTCDAGLSAQSRVNRGSRRYVAFSSSMAGFSRMGIRTRGSPRQSCAAFPIGPAEVWAAPSLCSR